MSAAAHERSATGSARRHDARGASLLALTLLLSACAMPRRAPLDAERVASSVEARGRSEKDLARALELADLGPLYPGAPHLPEARDPDRGAWWRACAWAWGPEVRAARRAFLARLAAATSAGLPLPAGLRGQTRKPDDPRLESELQLTFDLLGILGVGPAAAAAELSDAETRAAFGALEEAVWRSSFDVDRARVRLAAARARIVALAALLAETETDGVRLDVLAERGWLPAGSLAAARAMLGRLERHLATERAEAARRAEALVALCGLPPGAPALAALSPRTLEHLLPLPETPPEPGARELLERHPALRLRRLAYAVAEARLRRVAAEAWPSLALGPRLRLVPDATLLGGVVDVSVPWPGSVEGRIRAAEQERAAAREAVESALAAALARERAARARRLEARHTLETQAPAIAAGTRAGWEAARARFFVDAPSLSAWTDALERRIAGVQALADAQEEALLAHFDERQAEAARAREHAASAGTEEQR